MRTINEQIAHLEPCEDAVKWLGDRADWQAAWDECPRGDWLLWLLPRLDTRCAERGSEHHRRIVLAACECARLALKHVPAVEERPRLAIGAAEQWARGEGVTLEEVRAAACASGATNAATNAAHAASCAALAAASASYADAAYASYAATDADAAETLKKCADIVRRYFPHPPEVTQ